MIPLSIPLRQALGKLLLPLMIVLACLMIALGQADRPLAEHARMRVSDVLAPAYRLTRVPGVRARAILAELSTMGRMAQENARLRADNAEMRRWYQVAVTLANENEQLKASLHWIPDAVPTFVSGLAVRDAGGLYARAILLMVGGHNGAAIGDVAFDGNGLVGRVTEVGERSARVLLITDSSSRIPVQLASSHAEAIMAGDNTDHPRVIFYPQDNRPIEGERVLTGDRIDHVPAGLPIGTIHYPRPGQPVVQPLADLSRLGVVRLFDYGLSSVGSPQAPGRVARPPLPQPGLPPLLGRG
ncbi:rod shape-determining protein MreC [Ameyamaea chiangmaiensis NBRC 103196]|uniref:Cell shape-determining protein MreC n=1 Tax=Ameyamaea chiangmaiensis TaxID=442969 RepID=A0A850PAN6_9PROT|nr:rod shape-determining protein MreC [Ameyamaea chiangmaiensis]MBS4075776.1 rod shape-determining protein MreC [Ameyamaea chiangmaiensis]NVN41587.1 rod shape-determining protein MreC [Ameyamaea chiangmaiensis]GBQ63707.1 rod shape-determining protein MreC [Ameyamaea chiangmaiensis NBRC 103196]